MATSPGQKIASGKYAGWTLTRTNGVYGAYNNKQGGDARLVPLSPADLQAAGVPVPSGYDQIYQTRVIGQNPPQGGGGTPNQGYFVGGPGVPSTGRNPYFDIGYDPTQGGYPGGNGNFNFNGDGTGEPGGGGMSDFWKKYGPWITGGIPAIGDIIAGRRARETARQTQKGVERQRAETMGFAAPEYLLQLLNLYRGAYKEGYMPALRTMGETLALGEQAGMQGLESDVARRGLSGSGLHLAGRQALRTGRQASYNDAVRQFYMDVERAARGEAGQTASRQVSASLGAPFYHIPQAPGTLETIFNKAPDWMAAASDYQTLTKRQGQQQLQY